METNYKGYTIKEDYRNPYSNKPEYMYFPTDIGEDHDGDYDYESGTYYYTGNCKWADSIEEAKDEIQQIVFLRDYPNQWAVDHSKSLSPAAFDFLSDALGFCSKYDARPLFAFDAP
jgi:hypothetical protein